RSSNGSAFINFDVPGAVGSTFAKGINDAGQIVGSYPFDASGHGFLRSSDGSSFTTIDHPNASGTSSGGGFGTVATGINGSGQVVGYYFVGNSSHGFLRSSDEAHLSASMIPAPHCSRSSMESTTPVRLSDLTTTPAVDSTHSCEAVMA